MMRFAYSLMLAALLGGCDRERVQVSSEVSEYLAIFDCPNASGSYATTTIEQLIAEPEMFQEKAVRLSGFYHQSFENSAI